MWLFLYIEFVRLHGAQSIGSLKPWSIPLVCSINVETNVDLDLPRQNKEQINLNSYPRKRKLNIETVSSKIL